MPETLLLAGSAFNLLARAVAAPTATNENAQLPVSNIKDGDPGNAFRFNALAADLETTHDLNVVVNAAHTTHSSGVPTGFTNVSTGTGTVAQETTLVRSGNATRLNGGATPGTFGGAIRQSVTARSGESFRVDYWARGASAAEAMRLRVFNPRTQKYYSVGTGWTATPTDYHSNQPGTTYTNYTATVPVEGFAIVTEDTCPLELTWYTLSNGNIYLDDSAGFAGWNCVAVFGHNLHLEPALVPLARRSDDGTTYTTELTLTMRRGRFYAVTPSKALVYRRFFRYRLSGTPAATKPQTGELVVGQVVTLSRAPRHPNSAGWTFREILPQVRNETVKGNELVYPETQDPREEAVIPFRHLTEAQIQELREELFLRTAHGKHPAVIIPDDTKPRVLFGRIRNERSLDFWLRNSADESVLFRELPFPVSTA